MNQIPYKLTLTVLNLTIPWHEVEFLGSSHVAFMTWAC